MRLLTQSAFVDEDERTAFVLGFFLMRFQDWTIRQCCQSNFTASTLYRLSRHGAKDGVIFKSHLSMSSVT